MLWALIDNCTTYGRRLRFMVDLATRSGGPAVYYWAPAGSRANGMWNADGSPAPSIFVLDNLLKLMNSPANRLPPAP